MLRRHLLFAPALLPIAATPARAARINADGGIAVRGTDVVAYAIEGRPPPGLAGIAHDWAGARWLFATEAHRALFVREPARFAPAYGGFCAWAVARNYLAPIDPEAWRIVERRLFLNFDRRIQRRWERDIPGNISAAEANWPGLSRDREAPRG